MKSLTSWLTVSFMFMFWGFRIIVAYNYATGTDYFVQPIDFNTEITLLFFTLFCIILVIKRVTVAGIAYAAAYFAYFGVDIYNQVMPSLRYGSLSIKAGTDIFVSAMGLVLGILVVIDLLTDHVKAPDEKKTDWFFKNKNFERQHDSRDDKNNYKLY